MNPLRIDIQIKPGSLLADVQAAFSAHYPFLKIEFFENDGSHWTLQHSKIDPCTSRRGLVKEMQTIDISEGRTVAAVLQDFSMALGIVVKMCRKSGKVWNAISLTDGWTLSQQDAAGRYISSLMDGDDL